MSGVDPVQQTEVWLQDFMQAMHKTRWPVPPHSICLNVCRAMFSADCGLVELEAILQQFVQEKLKPSAYRWLARDIREAFEDLKHERAAKAKAATR